MSSRMARSDSVSESSSGGPDQEWLDIEPDEGEALTFVSIVSPSATFPSLSEMLAHDVQSGFDLVAAIRRMHLDFHGAVRLVNYVRTLAQRNEGKIPADELQESDFSDEKFLKPALENDALIFSLDDVLESDESEGLTGVPRGANEDDGQARPQGVLSEDELRAKTRALEEELEVVRNQFSNYRLAVQETLDRRWGDDADAGTADSSAAAGKESKGNSDSYFESYAYNDIHETMLKDAIRTDAYRDFIYGNKHIFQDKVVLDIGCGTGILSMFCAKAGAAKVIAVDKSDIITKARENVFHNGLADQITCLHGAIEEVVLPVSQVDIIVSEWMGYCLLYEAMLPSVLFARDKYLKPDGLLVPSSSSIWIAPIADPEFVSDHITYWRDVYGFDMKAMQEGIFDEVRVEHMPEQSICGASHPFKMLDLHRISVEDLVFKTKWGSRIGRDVDAVDGFTIWFDMFFGQSRGEPAPPAEMTTEKWIKQNEGNVAFTTSAFGTATHWKQGLLVAPPQEATQPAWKASDMISGEIEFSALEENARALGIEISWSGNDQGSQKRSWKLK